MSIKSGESHQTTLDHFYVAKRNYEHRENNEELKGYRNGYRTKRLETAIPVSVPQLRQTATPFESKLLSHMSGQTEVLDQLVAKMYTRGLSTRDIEEAIKDNAPIY